MTEDSTLWKCTGCGNTDGLSGGVTQRSKSTGTAGHCRWCDVRGVKVTRPRVPTIYPKYCWPTPKGNKLILTEDSLYYEIKRRGKKVRFKVITTP